MQSVATDPGHVIILTSSLINWTIAGLRAKHGYYLQSLEKDIYELIVIESDEQGNMLNSDTNVILQWEDAVDQYNAHKSFWGYALKKCRQVSEMLISICVAEDMLDYQIISTSITDQLNKMQIREADEDTSSKSKET
jgi:hypothetical protein